MPKRELIHKEITEAVISAFYEVYNTLGFGFLEHIYALALEYELKTRGHLVGREVSVVIDYKGFERGRQRIDLIVDEKVVIEVKSTSILPATASRQLYNYLHATHLEVGLLLHFGPKAQFQRIVCTNRRIRSAESAKSAESASPFTP
jgi:GxxExxY protein